MKGAIVTKADIHFEPPLPYGKRTTHDDFRNTPDIDGFFEITHVSRGVVTSFRKKLSLGDNVRLQAHAVLDTYLDSLGIKDDDPPVKIGIMETANRSN
jgi:hypothetical protein